MAIGRGFENFAAFNFTGGQNVKDSPQRLATERALRHFLREGLNVVYPQSGGVTKRPDAIAYNTVTLGASVGITGGFQLRLDNGTDINICGTTDGRVVKLNTDGTTTNLATGKTANARWYFDKFDNYATISNRLDAPMKYDGTTFGTLGGSPPALGGPHATHGNRTIFLDGGNVRRVTWSALNNGEDFTTASNAGTMTLVGPVGSPILSLLSMTSELLLIHRDIVTRLQGTSPSTYAVTNAVPAQVSTGGISPQGTVFGNNDAWWLSQRGVHNLRTTIDFGDLKESFASASIDPYFLPGTDFTLSLNQLEKSVAGYDRQNNRLYFGVDTNNDGQNDTILCLDVFLNLATKGAGGWSVWTGIPCASIWTAYTGSSGVEVFVGGYDGFVRRLVPEGAVNAINASAKHLSDLGLRFWQKHLRHLYIYLAEQSAGTLNVTTTFDFGYTGGQTYSVSMLGSSDVLGSTFILGTSVLGARSQIVKRLDTTGLGEFVEIQVSNAQAGQPFVWFGYEALFRRRRLIARAP